MKKLMIALAGLLLLLTYGCSTDEQQKTTENKTVIESQEKAAEMRGEETTVPNDTVKETKKKPVIEGC